MVTNSDKTNDNHIFIKTFGSKNYSQLYLTIGAAQRIPGVAHKVIDRYPVCNDEDRR